MQFTGEITKTGRWQRVRFLKGKSKSVLPSEAEISVTSVPFLWQEKSFKNGFSEFSPGCPNPGRSRLRPVSG